MKEQGVAPVDRGELSGKLCWIVQNLDSLDHASPWTELLLSAVLTHAQTPGGELQVDIAALSEEDAQRLLDLCEFATRDSGFVLQEEP